MAYIGQREKAVIAANLKPILKQYGMKGTLKINHHSSIRLTLQSGPVDFGKVNGDVNVYWIHDHYEGVAKEFLQAAYAALKSANWYDRSDAMTDYFDTAYYIYIRIGRWDKDYEYTGQKVVDTETV